MSNDLKVKQEYSINIKKEEIKNNEKGIKNDLKNNNITLYTIIIIITLIVIISISIILIRKNKIKNNN